ncbi:MAG: competence/damage-inducible protein A [Bacteroidales bacterium]|nr:competence/damage-inducible protein A [Bacteroidales bacterium]
MVQVEIVNIGDELLIGQVVNTNASQMAQKLNSYGFNVVATSVIGDSQNQIRESLDIALKRADCVLITGGLGPTKDDITKKTLSEYFNSDLIINKEVEEHVKSYFTRKQLPFTETNRAQALVPEKCKVIFNPVGTAPGMCFEKNGKLIVSMPGVPFEMRLMMDRVIEIMQNFFNQHTKILHKTLLYANIGESFLSDMISDFEDNLPDYISLAYLPKSNTIRLRLTAKTDENIDLEKILNEKAKQLVDLTKQYFMGFEIDNVATILGEKLKTLNKTLSIAESCTGGYISHLITSNAGSSQYYKGGVTAYANQTKENVLGVEKTTLLKFGAVSKEVAEQMSQGVMRELNSDYAIATTGIAGPGGGGEEKPVGTVWISVASNKNKVAEKYFFPTTRDNFIERASNQALLMLINLINEENPF